MKITDLIIDQFGVWQDLALPLSESGVNVFYGPNEAGKSTLMRFIRGVLYGYPQGQGQPAATESRAAGERGALRVRHGGRGHVVRRESQPGGRGRGRVRIDELDWGTHSEQRLSELLAGTSESLFERVFAVGLVELQELATLNADEIARQIYGVSLGPEGQRILRAQSEFEQQRLRLVHENHRGGELVTLAGQLESIDQQLGMVQGVSRRHRELRAERDRLTAHIEDCRLRQEGLRNQLRGHQFMDRVYGPWLRERKLRAERDVLPIDGTFPADALPRLLRIEEQLGERQQRRAALLAESKRLREQAERLSPSPELDEHVCDIRALAQQQEETRLRRKRIAEMQQQADRLASERRRPFPREADAAATRDHRESAAGPIAPDGLPAMAAAARAYQSALGKRARSVRKYKKLVAGTQKRQAELSEKLRPLGGVSIEAALRGVRGRLRQLEELARLRREESRLAAQSDVLDEQMSGERSGRELPPLFYFVLWFFTLAGVVLFFAGVWGAVTGHVAGGSTAWIVGAIYALLGLCAAGVTWTMKQHFEEYAAGGPSGVGERQRRIDRELRQVRQEIAALVSRSEVGDAAPGLVASDGASDESRVLRAAVQRAAELEALRQEEQRLQQDRRRLSDFREFLRARQREVGTRRRQWCAVLRRLGIAETLKIETAFASVPLAACADESDRTGERLRGEIEAEQRLIAEYEARVDRLASRLPVPAGIPRKKRERVVEHWVELLAGYEQGREERRRLRGESRNLRRQAGALEEDIARLRSQRRELFVQTGVSSREELETKSRAYERHEELTRQIAEVAAELRRAAAGEGELAVVEEDLDAFDAAENRQAMQTIEQELRDIDSDREKARERLGRLRSELEMLAADRTAVSLRFEREQLAGRLREVTEQWCALTLASDAIEQIRNRIERQGQSETLQTASEYLDRLTCGRYHNVWSPLGERHLRVDDDRQQSLPVEQLSTGTREQLFLALRLGIIRQFARQGLELPMVLDDVFVNFDQNRTEAAVDTLLEFAADGQQVLLFTCHLHLAHLFESKGIEPIWLPGHTPALEERRAG